MLCSDAPRNFPQGAVMEAADVHVKWQVCSLALGRQALTLQMTSGRSDGRITGKQRQERKLAFPGLSLFSVRKNNPPKKKKQQDSRTILRVFG